MQTNAVRTGFYLATEWYRATFMAIPVAAVPRLPLTCKRNFSYLLV